MHPLVRKVAGATAALDPKLRVASIFQRARNRVALADGSMVSAVDAARINTNVVGALISILLPRA